MASDPTMEHLPLLLVASEGRRSMATSISSDSYGFNSTKLSLIQGKR